MQKIFSAIRILISITIIASLFKLMHWPYSMHLYIIGLGGIFVLYPIRFFLKKEKTTLDYIKLIFVELFCFTRFVKIHHLLKIDIIITITNIIGLAWILFEIYNYINNIKPKYKTILPHFNYNYIFGLVIVVGVLFKLMHWPYANILLITGVILISAYFIYDSFKSKS